MDEMEFGNPKVESTMESHKSYIYTICISPTQTEVCSAGEERKAILTKFYDFKNQKVFEGHKDVISGCDFSSNGVFLCTASDDNTARVWNVESGESTVMKVYTGVGCVKFFIDDSKSFISGSDDCMIKIWDVERKEVRTRMKGKGGIQELDVLPGNQTVVAAENNPDIRIWDIRSGKIIKTISDVHDQTIRTIQFHPASFSLASGSIDQTIKIVDYRTYKVLQEYKDHQEWILSVCFHPSGRYLVAGSVDKKIRIYDLLKKKVLFTLTEDMDDWVSCVKFSPDGNFFASGCNDSKLLLWSFPLGRKFMKDKDEVERVEYLVNHHLFGDEEEEEERNIFKIRIDGFLSKDRFVILYAFKSILF